MPPACPGLTLRDAHPQDHAQLAALLLAAYDEYRPRFPPTLWEAYARDLTNISARAPYSTAILAETGEALVGTVTFYPQGDRGETWPATYAAVRLLAVAPDRRERGVGTALMAECIRRAQRLGRTHLGLHTTPLMAVARSWYQRMGFQRRPEHDLRYGPVVIEGWALELNGAGSRVSDAAALA